MADEEMRVPQDDNGPPNPPDDKVDSGGKKGGPSPGPGPDPDNTIKDGGDDKGGKSKGGGSGFQVFPTHLQGQADLMGQLANMYVTLWGTAPPPGYLEGLVRRGLNFYEVLDHERKKPAFRMTKFYRDQYSQMAQQVARALGRRS